MPPLGKGWASREVFRQRIDQALPAGQLLMELELSPIGERTDEADQIGREEVPLVGDHRCDLLPSDGALPRLILQREPLQPNPLGLDGDGVFGSLPTFEDRHGSGHESRKARHLGIVQLGICMARDCRRNFLI